MRSQSAAEHTILEHAIFESAVLAVLRTCGGVRALSRGTELNVTGNDRGAGNLFQRAEPELSVYTGGH